MSALLKIDVVTLFPRMFEGPFAESIIGKAQQKGLVAIQIHPLRKWSNDKRHAKVDDRTYGGGAGMLLQAEPLYQAIKALGGLKKSETRPWVISLSPQGQDFKQSVAQRLVKKKHLIILCGHYEGMDERVTSYIDQEISMGDFVLTGGEIPAMAVVDAVVRLMPGVVGDPRSLVEESFAQGLLEYPHYTRPAVWRGQRVPKVLLSGHHENIALWRKREALEKTKRKKPWLLKV